MFGLPGIGNLVVSAVLRRDYPVIQGALLVIAGLYVLINLAIDLLYLVVDPRVDVLTADDAAAAVSPSCSGARLVLAGRGHPRRSSRCWRSSRRGSRPTTRWR